jgi:hypoxanthine phosphoribosyltransferase
MARWWKSFIIGFSCIVLVVALWIAVFCAVATAQLRDLEEQMREEDAPPYFPKEALAIVKKKRAVSDPETMMLKMALTPCYKGLPRWSTLERVLIEAAEKFPRNLDGIMGIKSGGWLIGLMLSKILNLPCYKLTYTRYTEQTTTTKAVTYFKGKRQAQRPPDWTNADNNVHMEGINQTELLGKRILLVDDTVASGATMRTCDIFLRGCGVKEVLCFAVCATKQNTVNYFFTDKHLLYWPWGIDV